MNDPLYSRLQPYFQEAAKRTVSLLELIILQSSSHDDGEASITDPEYHFSLFFPNIDVKTELDHLREEEFIVEKDQGYTLHPSLDVEQVKKTFYQLLGEQEIPLVPGTTLEEVWNGFLGYLQENEPRVAFDNAKSHPLQMELIYRQRKIIIEVKSLPFLIPPPGHAWKLTMGLWDSDSLPQMAPFFVEKPWLKRAAFYNLNTAGKANIVPSGLFPYFDWYLRDEFRLRVAPCREFTLELMNRGIMRVEG